MSMTPVMETAVIAGNRDLAKFLITFQKKQDPNVSFG
jgi:hypothetical protein